MRLFSQTESELFESLFHERLQPIRDRHFTEVDRIHWSNSPHKLNLLISEHKKFKKEFIEARVQAYLEMCRETSRYPDPLDYQEFAAELTGLVKGATDDISRAYNDPLSPIRAQSLERTMEILQQELGQIVGPAMAPVQRLVAEGKLAAPCAGDEGGDVGCAAKRLGEFQEYIGKPCRSLGDLDWSVTKTFLDNIPTDLERVDFLQELGKLPDEGIVNNSIVNPAKHNRNTNTFIRPLRDECSRLLSRHFNLENIIKHSEQISENGEALSYLWRLLRDYKKYHPGTRQNHYLPDELAFCQTIEAEIEYRRDMEISSSGSKRLKETKTVACPHCNHGLSETARFCENCGVPLDKFNATTLRNSGDVAVTLPMGDPLIGRVLDGKYKILARIGEGGVGAVYRAERTRIGDEVAIKVLHSQFATDSSALERFRIEARAAAALHHPQIVVIHDFGEASGADTPAFIVMELLVGQSLRNLLKREGKLEPTRAITLVSEICAGVGAAHNAGIFHRDLKPENIIILPPQSESRAETLKIVDFGIAKLRDLESGRPLTEVGARVGTPSYMSPEQCRGVSVNASSDVYSLGVILYEMLAGTAPFTADNNADIISKQLHENPPALSADLNLPISLVAVILRALSKEPDERQPDATALSRELKNIANGRTRAFDAVARKQEAATLEIPQPNFLETVTTFLNLEEIDTFVFEASCQRAMNADYPKHISVRELLKDLETLKITQDDLIDSLEILANRGYIQPGQTVGCGLRICEFDITTSGFEQYAKAYIVDYETKVESVMNEILWLKKEVFDKPDIVVEHVLDKLADEGRLQIAKFSGGKIRIMHVSAELRRQFRDEQPEPLNRDSDAEVEAPTESRIAQARKIADEIRYKKERESWFRSVMGRGSAETEIGNLFDELRSFAEEINEQGREINIDVESDGKEECILRCRGIVLLASWNSGRIVNTLEGTGLTMKLSEREGPLYVGEPEEIRKVRYDIEMAPNGDIGWRETKGSNQVLPSSKVADIWTRDFMDEIARSLTK